ncbi:MAG: EF-P lysine aminoacylase EpmA [Candidatus Neptunochlamydia sp.]|nr:EF-P lysine aminoacylase EpmA [Candidatus Neptunochlamydia sp.]
MSLALRNNLIERAQSLKDVRAFFEKSGVTEVDTPILSPYAPIDTHIDLFEVNFSENEKGYLHSSPEYGMKKLLVEGSGDIYQLGHVFRKNEVGHLHRPEFTMIEWYRINGSQTSFLKENLDLLSLFLGNQSHEILTYREAFEKHLGIAWDAPKEKLLEKAKDLKIHDTSDLINILWGCFIEPQLGAGKITIITDYPKDQAALAQIKTINGEEVAERFEFYFNGIELGNGYHELTDLIEQKNRLTKENKERVAMGKTSLPFDPELIKSLEKGLPDCYGIAWGFDRLLMLKLGLTQLF